MAVVYRHRRNDTNEIFYIGISNSYKRAYIKSRRNNHWKNIISKTDYSIEIIAENISREDACELEIFLISLYGRKDLKQGNLVNMTEGGDGVHIYSKESINKMRLKALNMSTSHKNKIRKKKVGKNNPMSKKIINIINGEIFNSIKEASVKNNISYSTLRYHLTKSTKNRTGLVYLNKNNIN